MKTKLLHTLILAGLFGCSGARAKADEDAVPRLFPVRGHALVKEVHGEVFFASEGAGWKALTPGQVLRPGVSIRVTRGSSALLLNGAERSFVKVPPASLLRLTFAPQGEDSQPVLAERSPSKSTKKEVAISNDDLLHLAFRIRHF